MEMRCRERKRTNNETGKINEKNTIFFLNCVTRDLL